MTLGKVSNLTANWYEVLVEFRMGSEEMRSNLIGPPKAQGKNYQKSRYLAVAWLL